VRDCLSEEILLARPLLLKGVISDGQETIGSAVTFVFPEVPHQRCQFHSLKDAIKPFYAADRHAKAQLKKQMRGVRPVERALEEQSTPIGLCIKRKRSWLIHSKTPVSTSVSCI